MLEAAAEFVAVTAGALFAGAALYITLVEHPARLACGTVVAATEFAPSYERAKVMQASLAACAALAGACAWWLGGSRLWLVGAALIAAVIPFTLIVVAPTNAVLLDPGLDRGAPATRARLGRWGRLHAVRTVLGLLATAVFVGIVVAGPVVR